MMLLAIGALLAAVAAAAWAARKLRRGLAIVEIQGASMEPTFRSGDRVLVSRVPTRGVRIGDIVVLERGGSEPGDERPTSPGRLAQRDWVVKRAAAVAGDPVPESVAPAAGVAPGTAVPAGLLVVLGDNPAHSADSRVWGLLPTDRLLGVVLRRLSSSAG